MKFFIAALSVSFLIISCKQRPEMLTEQEVISAISKFDEGWRHKDMQQVDAVLAASYIYFTQSGGTFIRDSVVHTAGSPSYTLDTVERKEIEVQLNQNTAIVSTRWMGKGMYKGVPFNEDQRCSITVMKLNGKVQILSEHCTPIKHNSIFH